MLRRTLPRRPHIPHAHDAARQKINRPHSELASVTVHKGTLPGQLEALWARRPRVEEGHTATVPLEPRRVRVPGHNHVSRRSPAVGGHQVGESSIVILDAVTMMHEKADTGSAVRGGLRQRVTKRPFIISVAAHYSDRCDSLKLGQHLGKLQALGPVPVYKVAGMQDVAHACGPHGGEHGGIEQAVRVGKQSDDDHSCAFAGLRVPRTEQRALGAGARPLRTPGPAPRGFAAAAAALPAFSWPNLHVSNSGPVCHCVAFPHI